MSDAVSYLSEPATAGKLVLHTTIGDLDIELFSQQTPQTCRTFLSLALRHAYNGCTFHRIERDFLAQTGDLATSALPHARLQHIRTADWYTTPLKPELHSRLRFTRRGLIGLARSAKPALPTASSNTAAVEDNSQFFITLAATAELSGEHTLFGKVTGDTLYNLSRLNDSDVAAPNSAIQVRINSVQLLSCPWPELTADVEREEREWRVREEEEERRRKKTENGNNKLARRNVHALSFGADEVDESEEQQADRRKRGKGLHDVLGNDSRLAMGDDRENGSNGAEREQSPAVSRPAVEGQRPAAVGTSDNEDEDEDAGYEARMRDQVLRNNRASADSAHATSASASSADIKQQIQQLTKQLFPSQSAAPSSSDSAAVHTAAVSVLEQRKQRFMQLTRRRSDDPTSSTDTMAKLARFRTKLQHAQPIQPSHAPSTAAAALSNNNRQAAAADDEQRQQPTTTVDWVTASASLLRDADDEEEMRVRGQERAEGMAWMRHRLQFARRPQDYAEEEGSRDDGLVVFDPTGREGSKEEVRMGRKGLGVESKDGKRDGGRDRERTREDRSRRTGGSDSRERRDKR